MIYIIYRKYLWFKYTSRYLRRTVQNPSILLNYSPNNNSNNKNLPSISPSRYNHSSETTFSATHIAFPLSIIHRPVGVFFSFFSRSLPERLPVKWLRTYLWQAARYRRKNPRAKLTSPSPSKCDAASRRTEAGKCARNSICAIDASSGKPAEAA